MKREISIVPEWILTNRRGGYALGSADLINRRKYHGLLVASNEGLRRLHLVSSVEEKFLAQDCVFFLDSNQYPDVVYPNGSRFMKRYRLRPFPAFLYSLTEGGKNLRILKEILMDEQENVTLLRYSNLGKETLEFFFRYKFSLRNHHYVNHPGSFEHSGVESGTFISGRLQWGWARRGWEDCTAYVYCSVGQMVHDPLIFRNVTYTAEQERGYDAVEDLCAPFLHRGILKPGESMEVLLSDRELEGSGKKSFESAVEKIQARYSGYSLPEDHPSLLTAERGTVRTSVRLSEREYKKLLYLLMDEFQTERDIVAGYPWFSSWGRDTMIALEGFTVREEKLDFVSSVLRNYGQRIHNGLLPNVIGEDGKGTNYDTIDASLWYILRTYECFDTLSGQRKDEFFEYCSTILLNYRYSEKLPFFFDEEDFLISIRDGISLSLTWMDAKVNNEPVTPRYGKPIEINGLWYNAVVSVRRMAEELGKKRLSSGEYSLGSETLAQYERVIKKSMEKYYVNGIWCDRIEDAFPIAEIRPNFVIACSLPFDFVGSEGLRAAFELARSKLLTPYGLRSLSVESPLFHGVYGGTQEVRDRAYHQGTVWTWLLLPYAHLLKKVISDTRVLKRELLRITAQLRSWVKEGHIASVAEVWDGENPTIPKGAPVQAWSTAALLCIEKMIDELE